jgi:hypothetical protein
MDTLHYYELKQKYQENMDRRKKLIKKNKTLDLKERRAAIKKIIGKCVNCGKTGGTIFEERNGTLKAVCGGKNPCDLNINIKRKLYDNMRELEQKNNKRVDSLKMLIIMAKLDYLFGLISSKDEIVDKFNTYKTELSQISESQLIIHKRYGDIISGVHREPLLNDANLDLINEIAELKKTYQEYLQDPAHSTAYLTSMVEKYLTTIKPLTEKIRDMNYAYYAIESNVEKFEDRATLDKEGEVHVVTVESNDDDAATDNKAFYTLVALPYLIEEMEQERK